MPEGTVGYVRGEFCAIDDARVSVRSKAFNYGLGVFEGIRGYWNAKEEQLYLFRAPEHYRRLLNSCRICRLVTSKTVGELLEITSELVRRNKHREDVYIRPILYVDSELLSPTLVDEECDLAMWTLPLTDYLAADGITAMVSSWRRVADNMIPPRAKPTAAYLNSALARAEAKDAGCDEAIFLTQHGYVAEGSAEHVIIVRDGRLITPPTEDDSLEGVTQKTIAEVVPAKLGLPVESRHIGRTELYIADEVFFVGTGAQVVPVVRIDHRPVGNGRPGRITNQVMKVYSQVVHGKLSEYAHWCHPVY